MKVNNKLLWYMSSIALFTGAILPMFSFNKFFIFNSTYSLLSGVIYLFKEGELLLFTIIFVFSIVFPIIKMQLLYLVINNKVQEHEKGIIAEKLLKYGKWSMLDVFVVAILASTVKLGTMANIEVHPGLTIFALGVLGSMWLTKNISSSEY